MTRATPEVGTTGLKQYRREGEQDGKSHRHDQRPSIGGPGLPEQLTKPEVEFVRRNGTLGTLCAGKFMRRTLHFDHKPAIAELREPIRPQRISISICAGKFMRRTRAWKRLVPCGSETEEAIHFDHKPAIAELREPIRPQRISISILGIDDE